MTSICDIFLFLLITTSTSNTTPVVYVIQRRLQDFFLILHVYIFVNILNYIYCSNNRSSST